MPGPDDARLALAAHNLLRVDAGWLSPKAALWLKGTNGKIPTGYIAMGDKVVTRIVDTAAGKIGLVFFPQGPVPEKAPTPEQEEQALAAGKALHGKVNLVIGISPWGAVGETAFLRKASGVFGCLLGSGEGIGFAQSLSEARGVFWVRPDSQGRAINVLEILEMPAPGTTPEWLEGVTFRANMDFLDDSCPTDAAMLRLIGAPPPR
ncbi:hypothetical protein LJC59_04575 [Desulfovibrio sp. OttesenSCG-928-A18]|nr:hypothetical protein [Desulfovibrio sp. OttesenSCG-928-A18]